MPEEPTIPLPHSRVVAKKRTGVSLVWVFPIVAAAVGVWVAVTRIMNTGPKLTIVFKSAEGLEAGKTKIEYHGLAIGTLTRLRLADDRQHVIGTAQMSPDTDSFFVQDTEFWVVRPRVSGAHVSGLDTLISGAFVEMQMGHSNEPRRDFTALSNPPIVTEGTAGRFFVLKTSDLGSIDDDTPLFFRRLQVGEVAAYNLDKDGREFTLKVFVRAPYDQYVTSNTRFWQASGVDLQLTASGLRVETQSMLSILIGGVAFETPANGPVLSEADENSEFTLYGDRAAAFQSGPKHPLNFELIFNESVNGLHVGAPVEMRGIRIGEVQSVQAQVDLKTMKFSIPVMIQLDARRLGVKINSAPANADMPALRRRLIDSLVAHGVRAQLRTGSLITGAAMVEFDFFPNAAPVAVDWSQNPVQLPTVPGALQETEANLTDFIRKVDKLPLQQISDGLVKNMDDLDQTLVSARSALASAQNTMTNADQLVGSNSLQVQQMDNTLQELSRAARSVRVLADYLERHPEALLRGKRGENK